MKEISKGQWWWDKDQDLEYGSWGAVVIDEELGEDKFLVHIYTEPLTRDVVMTKEEILKDYYLYEKNKI
jgi:hypothetical protein